MGEFDALRSVPLSDSVRAVSGADAETVPVVDPAVPLPLPPPTEVAVTNAA